MIAHDVMYVRKNTSIVASMLRADSKAGRTPPRNHPLTVRGTLGKRDGADPPLVSSLAITFFLAHSTNAPPEKHRFFAGRTAASI